MSWLGSVLSSVGHGLSDAGRFAVHGAEDGAKAVASGVDDGAKAVASGVEDGWKSALNGAKAAVGALGTGVRTLDAAKEQLGSWIDSGEKSLENKVDEGRAWLRQHGGVAGQVASDWIGFGEGVDISLYDAGKGLVQLANTAGSLADPIEWAANPSANIARVKSTVNTVETLGKIAGLADPTSWITNPQGNAQLAGALWHSAATSFENDPAKFIGNAVGTIGTFFIPGADAAGAAGDAARVTELATDASKAAAITGDVSKAAAVTQDAGRAAAVTEDAGRAASVSEDAGRMAAAAKDGTEAGTAGEAQEPVQISLRGVDHTIPDWHMQEISYTKRTDAAREALRAEFPPVRKAFVKDLAENDAAALREAGMSDADIALMAKGRVPAGYQVHHLLPLDDGGTNATSNLVLIKNDPDHMLITQYQIEQTQGMSAGQTRKLEWPMPDSQVSVWPQTPDGGAYPTKH